MTHHVKEGATHYTSFKQLPDAETVLCAWCYNYFNKLRGEVLGSQQEKFFCDSICYQLFVAENPYTAFQEALIKAVYLLGDKSTRFFVELFGRDRKTIIQAARKLSERGYLTFALRGSSSSWVGITNKGKEWAKENTELEQLAYQSDIISGLVKEEIEA